MQLKFTKMHGLGNDFVVIDAINQQVDLTNNQIREIADRKFGVGCDQLLLVEKPRSPGVDFRYRIFNADGSEVEQCGNGARCFARFVKEKGLTTKKQIPVETKNGNIILILKGDDVTVNMGAPNLTPESLPFTADKQQTTYEIEVEGETIEISAISMGNPHAVTVVSDTSSAPVLWLGPKIEKHEVFPNRVNAGFMQIVDRQNINLRVFERGCGETLACGTGACAAVVAGITRGQLDSTVNVTLPGGKLVINWEGGDSPVMMTGPATVVFEGVLEI